MGSTSQLAWGDTGPRLDGMVWACRFCFVYKLWCPFSFVERRVPLCYLPAPSAIRVVKALSQSEQLEPASQLVLHRLVVFTPMAVAW